MESHIKQSSDISIQKHFHLQSDVYSADNQSAAIFPSLL